MRAARWSLRAQLLVFTLGVAAPLLALVALGAKELSKEADLHVRSASAGIAGAAAHDVAREVERLKALILQLSERPGVRKLDPAACDPLLAELAALKPLLLDVVTFRPDGTVLCATRTGPPGSRVSDATAGLGRRPSNILFGALSQRHVAVLAQRILSPAGDAGVLSFVLDLEDLAAPFNRGTPPGTEIYVVDARGLVITAAGVPGAVGRRAADLGLPGAGVRVAVAEDVADAGGRRHVVTRVPVAGTEWITVAAIPSELASAPARRLVLRSALGGLLALAIMLFAAKRLGAWITAPVAALAATVRATRVGDHARAPVDGPWEIAEVARELNAALEARQETERSRTAAAVAREVRLAWEALEGATSHRLLAAAPDGLAAELAPALERIRAFLEVDAATIVEAQPERMRVVASARRERFPPEALEVPAEALDCPIAVAELLDGVPFSFESLEALEPRAPVDAGTFRKMGLESLHAQPLRAHGVTIGALCFASRTPRGWPEEVLRHTGVVAELFSHALARLDSERALRQSEEETRRLKEFYATILDNVREGILVTDTADRIQYANRTQARMLGVPRERLHGRFIGEFAPPDPDPEIRAQYERARAQLQPTPYEGRSLLPDGRAAVQSGWFVPLVRKGAFGGMVCTAEDVTERRVVEEALRKTQDQFLQAQKMEAVGRLAGGVAHDFNNILSVILSYAELLHQELPGQDPRRADVQEIVAAARGGANLTRQLLAFSRKQVSAPRVVRLGELVAGAQKLLKRLIGEDLALEVTGTEAPALVRVDPGHLEQVLLNLAVNARDAMPGGGRLAIAVGTVATDAPAHDAGERIPAGRWVTLSVADTGCGMDEATRARAFEPFFSTKGPGKGTGLGLATVYGIVQQAGGRVVAESAPGKGATFRIYLPEVDPETLRGDEEDGPDGEPAAAPAVPQPSREDTVLVVEDDAALRHLMQRVLAGAGYRVLSAASGDEALRAATTHRAPIRLLLSDVVMPGMNGRDLASRLAAARPELRTLFISGYTDDILGQHGVLDPETHLLHKPFTHPQLLAAVRRRLDLAA